jgi:hypothetical protein
MRGCMIHVFIDVRFSVAHYHISACQASHTRVLHDLPPRQVQRGCSTSGISYISDIDIYSTVLHVLAIEHKQTRQEFYVGLTVHHELCV